MQKNTVSFASVLLIAIFVAQSFGQTSARARSLTAYVDPFVGVDNGGNTVPGAKVPFGFANPSPDTLLHDTSGYDSKQPIIGFSNTHVSGTGGGSKYGNFRVTPLTGSLRTTDLASPKSDEIATPGYYSVNLTRSAVKAELTATRLTAVHRYTFPATEQAHLLFDVSSAVVVAHGVGRQYALDCEARITAPNRIEGTGNFTGGWNTSPYTIHFSAEFSRPVSTSGTWRGDRIEADGVSTTGVPTGVFATFNTTANPVVEVNIGISFVSPAKARLNLEQEVGTRNFDQVRRQAEQLWQETLSRISVEGGSEDERSIFYTALYRSHYMPHDVSGENVWWDSKEPHYEDYYCLWDTFRTLHPLLTILQPDRQRDMVRSLIDTYKHTGWMPDARIAGANGLTQGGSNADVLIADAMAKGLTGIDYRTAYEAMRKNAEVNSPRSLYEGREVEEYNQRGFISLAYARSASRTVEYAYNDFCLAQVAKGLGNTADYQKYLARSKNWENLWDDETKSIRPRQSNGKWLAPYSPTHVYPDNNFAWWGAPYYEGSGYQYSTYVPHDAQSLIKRTGGDSGFVKWLDNFFNNTATGDKLFNGGLYTQNNEPDILAAFLYIHAGRPDRTQEQVRRILTTEYRLGRAGLPGNDDAGTMSSWYVWNAIGLYPNAGQNFYYIGSPVFRQTRINVSDNQNFQIEALNVSATNKYVASATLNGKPLLRAWLTHDEIRRGGKLVLQMSAQSTQWGGSNRPPSMSLLQP